MWGVMCGRPGVKSFRLALQILEKVKHLSADMYEPNALSEIEMIHSTGRGQIVGNLWAEIVWEKSSKKSIPFPPSLGV